MRYGTGKLLMNAHDESKACCHEAAVDGSARQAEAGSESTVDLAGKYVCPMCPDVLETEPVPCPHCGMALERVRPVTIGQGLQYTCPMHPEVIRDEPGDCPICGMALNPLRDSAPSSFEQAAAGGKLTIPDDQSSHPRLPALPAPALARVCRQA